MIIYQVLYVSGVQIARSALFLADTREKAISKCLLIYWLWLVVTPRPPRLRCPSPVAMMSAVASAGMVGVWPIVHGCLVALGGRYPVWVTVK